MVTAECERVGACRRSLRGSFTFALVRSYWFDFRVGRSPDSRLSPPSLTPVLRALRPASVSRLPLLLAGEMALSPEQVADAMREASADLKFLFDREKVEKEIQAAFYHAGITTVPQFAAFVADAEELRKSLKDDFNLTRRQAWPRR